MTHEEWEKFMKDTGKRNNPKDPYFSEEFPHVLMIIENAHFLSRHNDK